MSQAKVKSLEFPATDKKFNSAFTGLMGHLAIADPDSGSTTITWTRLNMDGTTIYNPWNGKPDGAFRQAQCTAPERPYFDSLGMQIKNPSQSARG